MVIGPSSTTKHKEERFQWAKNYSHWRTRLRRVVFSDEKFNLDDLDGFAYYWHDLLNEQQYFSKRQQGGASVTIWAAISFDEVSNIAVLDVNLNSEKYCDILSECLLPFAAEECTQNWIYKQDNATCHRSNYTKTSLGDNYVDVLPWISRCTDINIIENLWCILFRSVYKYCKQYGSKEELKKAIHKYWNKIEPATTNNFYDSMHRRCIIVIERNGRKIKY